MDSNEQPILIENIRAALRLDYRDIGQFYSASVSQVFIHDILELTTEVYQSLAAKCIRAPIVMAAEGLFRANCELILHMTLTKGAFVFQGRRKRIEFLADEVSSESIFQRMNLSDTIVALHQNMLIDDGTRRDMDILRILRNKAVHGELPGLLSKDPPSTITTEEEFDDLIEGRRLLPPRDYFFFLEIDGQKIKYTVDRIKLGIDLDLIDRYQSRLPVLTTKIYLHCLKETAKVLA